jgi:hypothetical protein
LYLLQLIREFLGRRYENRHTKVATWDVRGQCLLANLDRLFFHNNDVCKQNRIAEREGGKINLKYNEGKK